MAAKRSLPTFISIITNLIALIFLTLLLFSGLNSRLTNLYWLSTSTAAFTTPSRLSASSYLTALSNLSQTDYTGPNSTATSLGLPAWTSIHLLTACAHYSPPDSRSTECTPPQFGFAFSPAKHLRLESTTALQGDSSSASLASALEAYEKASKFVSVAYTVTAVLSLVAPVLGWFYPAHWAASVVSGVGGVLSLAATITATVVFRRVAEGVNADLGGYGLTAGAGAGPVVMGFVAGLLMGVAAGGYWVGYRRGTGMDGLVGRRSFGVGGKKGGGEDAGSEYRGAAGKGGLFGRVTGGRHKYVQIDEHTGAMPGGERGPRDGSPDGIRPNRLDEDWAAPDEYAGARGVAGGKTSSGPAASIPLMALGGGNKQTRDRDTAYEPYTDPR